MSDEGPSASAQASSSSSSSLPPPPSSSARPSAHTQRYDRQLRLWASSGQASLESAHVVVLGATFLGACILKNVVLPGLGSFTLVDGRKVDDADLGSNFFVEQDSKGKSRAHEVTRNLLELNPQVKGVAVEQDPAEWVAAISVEELDKFTLIVTANQPTEVLLPLADKTWRAKAGVGVALMVVNGSGLIGSISVHLKESCIVETHPEHTIDLRLTRPWPALREYAERYDMDTADSMARSHIPFSVLLMRKLQAWTMEYGDKDPRTDRKTFIASINALRGASQADDENVDEAISALGQHVWRPLAIKSSMPDSTAALLKDEACTHVTQQSTNFWLLASALRKFVDESGNELPLPGGLPDMKALSSTYVDMQRIYRAKAAEDVARLRKHLDSVLQSVDLPVDAISDDEVASFAKHAAYLKVIRGRRWQECRDAPNVDTLTMDFENPDPSQPVTAPYYFALVSAEEFYDNYSGRYPGSSLALSNSVTGKAPATASGGDTEDVEPPLEEDTEELATLAKARLASWNIELSEEQLDLVSDACAEVARAGHADLPSTAALLGGVAAQEAIKLVTHQYVPLDNTAVYDGVRQAIGVFRV